MGAEPKPTVFISYSHADKRVARRLVRRLTAHGIKVWIDERELRLGAALTASVRSQIQGAGTLLVVASQASAASKWVGMELEFAREQGKVIVPLFIEPLDQHERFRDHLGVCATLPQAFAGAVHDLMRDLHRAMDLELPPADPALLKRGLLELASQESDLAPLINGCLESQGLHQENMDTVHQSAFHPLDEALHALFDLMPAERMAFHAAYGFAHAGAGTQSLFSWIAASGDGGTPLVMAVGSRSLDTALIPTAIQLLGACNPPNNHALYNFIDRNAAQLDSAQRRSVMRLVTWPVREDTSRLADVLGWVALKHFPDAVEVQQMWRRWVERGAFDGSPSTPANLARYLGDAHKEGLSGWEDVHEALRSHVRSYLRSGDKSKVFDAVDHIQAAANAGAPILAALLREANGVSGTAEWEEWEQRDRETAELMGYFVHNVTEEATGDRNWRRAWEDAKQMVSFEEQRRRVLGAREEREPDRGT